MLEALRADFISVGDVMLDVVLRAEPPAPSTRVHAPVVVRAGGSAATAAAWAAAAGASSAVVGRVGDDLAGYAVANAIRETGVESALAVDSERATGTVVLLGQGRGVSVVADRGANAGLSPADVPRSLAAPAVLVSGYALLQPDTEAAARAALDRATSAWLAVDVGSVGLVASRGVEAVLALTQGVSVLLANEDEARLLTGEDAASAARALAERYPVACVTRGDQGAVACQGGNVEVFAGTRVDSAVSLGSGDAFAAGLLVALGRGGRLSSALAVACRMGASAVVSGGWPPPRRVTASDAWAEGAPARGRGRSVRGST